MYGLSLLVLTGIGAFFFSRFFLCKQIVCCAVWSSFFGCCLSFLKNMTAAMSNFQVLHDQSPVNTLQQMMVQVIEYDSAATSRCFWWEILTFWHTILLTPIWCAYASALMFVPSHRYVIHVYHRCSTDSSILDLSVISITSNFQQLFLSVFLWYVSCEYLTPYNVVIVLMLPAADASCIVIKNSYVSACLLICYQSKIIHFYVSLPTAVW